MSDINNQELLRGEKPAAVEQRDGETRQAVTLLESAVQFLRSLEPIAEQPVSPDHPSLDTTKVLQEQHEQAVDHITENHGTISSPQTPNRAGSTLAHETDGVISDLSRQIDAIYADQPDNERNPLEGVL